MQFPITEHSRCYKSLWDPSGLQVVAGSRTFKIAVQDNRNQRGTRDMKHSIAPKSVLMSLVVLAGLQLASAQTITTNMMAPPGFVNTSIPGMKMYIVQGNSGLPMDQVHRAEALISGKAIDPMTGQPFAAANAATPDPADG